MIIDDLDEHAEVVRRIDRATRENDIEALLEAQIEHVRILNKFTDIDMALFGWRLSGLAAFIVFVVIVAQWLLRP